MTTASDGVTDPGPGLWIELHMVDMADELNPVFSGRATLNIDGSDVTRAGTLARSFGIEGPVDGLWVSFAVDYVFPTWYPEAGGGFVYDPGLNSKEGFTTVGRVATQLGDHGATAFTDPVWVTCR
ncbi:MAG: hypothetical protein MUO50_04380 [Longimicrobiales bacterium]|nr:hypothetical protein [Longimicrobiales bacterium]